MNFELSFEEGLEHIRNLFSGKEQRRIRITYYVQNYDNRNLYEMRVDPYNNSCIFVYETANYILWEVTAKNILNLEHSLRLKQNSHSEVRFFLD